MDCGVDGAAILKPISVGGSGEVVVAGRTTQFQDRHVRKDGGKEDNTKPIVQSWWREWARVAMLAGSLPATRPQRYFNGGEGMINYQNQKHM
jgi:hypothetical protein